MGLESSSRSLARCYAQGREVDMKAREHALHSERPPSHSLVLLPPAFKRHEELLTQSCLMEEVLIAMRPLMLSFQDTSLCSSWQSTPQAFWEWQRVGCRLIWTHRIHSSEFLPGSSWPSFCLLCFLLFSSSLTRRELHIPRAAFQSNLGNGKFKSNLHLFPKLDGFQ